MGRGDGAYSIALPGLLFPSSDPGFAKNSSSRLSSYDHTNQRHIRYLHSNITPTLINQLCRVPSGRNPGT
jgi:hypothetical protein